MARRKLRSEQREFIDAQRMAREHPKTFWAPPRRQLDTIQRGDHVKVCANPERFWVMVSKVVGDRIEGVVDNDLIETKIHGLKADDRIQFEKRHVYDVMRAT